MARHLDGSVGRADRLSQKGRRDERATICGDFAQALRALNA
jgi:hypothetical protein